MAGLMTVRRSLGCLLAVGALLVARPARAAGGAGGECPNLYTDGEARELILPARRAVPTGKFRRKDVVLKALSVDPARLCNRRVVQMNLGYVEVWQVSNGFDLIWSAAVRDRRPLEATDHKIFEVRVVPRETAPPGDVRPQVVEDAKESWLWMATNLSSSGYAADLSPVSLWEIDRFFDEQSRRGKARPGGLLSRQLGSRLFAIGAYVGEVIRRARGGEWIADDDHPRAENNVAVRLFDGTILWPVQRVMKRFKNGAQDGIAAYGLGLGLEVGPGPQ